MSDDIFVRIERGDYRCKLPYPDKPKKHGIFNKRAGDLSNTELRELPIHRQAYDNALAEYDKAKKAYYAEDGRLQDKFIRDLAEYHGIPADDPFFQAMWGIAYQQGHSGGYSEIANEFLELMPLWELYAKKKGGS